MNAFPCGFDLGPFKPEWFAACPLHGEACPQPRRKLHGGIWFRPAREYLIESMAQVREFEILNEFAVFLKTALNIDAFEIKPYSGLDDRIGWNATFIVMGIHEGSDRMAPVGYTDGPIEALK